MAMEHIFDSLRLLAMEHQKSTSMAKDDSYLDSVLAKRIKLFESIQAQQRADRQSLPSDPIK